MQTQNTAQEILDNVPTERQFFNSLGDIYPAHNNVSLTMDFIADVQCYWLEPKQKKDKQILIYLHGGGFAMGGIQSHKAMVSHIASTLETKTLFIEYALAPEHPYPTALNQVISIYRILNEKFPDYKFIFMGDSAGGGLAISAIHRILEGRLPIPNLVVLISPWINLKCNSNSYKLRKEKDPILTKEMTLKYADYYLPEKNKSYNPDELIFLNFPPVFLLVGSREILYCDTKNFYDYIKNVQKNSTFKEYKNQTHVWLQTDIHSVKSQEALTDIRKFIYKNNPH